MLIRSFVACSKAVVAVFRLFCVIVLVGVLARPAAAESSQPNIVFILTDDLGWGDLGCFYQNESTHDKTHKTPQLDALAASGMQLRRHYCPAPVCAPSRSSLFTGVHQGNAIVRDNQFDKALEDGPTLGSVLQTAGYRTALVGKYGLQGGEKANQQTGTPDDWPAYPTRRGFDEFFGYVSHYAGHLHYPNDPWELANDGHQGTPNLWHSIGEDHAEISDQLSKCYTTDLFTAKSKQWIVDHTREHAEQPFFLMLTYDTPHAALQIPTVAYPEGRGVGGGLQWTGKPGAMINTARGEVDSFRHPDYTGHGWDDMEERFATMVRRIDSAVGDLNQTLVDLGIDQNTLVVFTSDNGPHHEAYVAGDAWGNGRYTPQSFRSYGPFDGTKRDCYEGGIRMPTLAWWPGTIAAGTIDQTPSQFHDWLPTFCRMAGTPIPARVDGVSMLPILKGEKAPERTVYIEYVQRSSTPKYDDFLPSRRGAARKQMQVFYRAGYKGVRTDIQSADDDFQIYDVLADPDEAHDLAGEKASLNEAMKRFVLRMRSPNESAPRPYDDAPIPGYSSPVPNEEPLPDGDADFKQGVLRAETPGRYRIVVTAPQPVFARLWEGHLVDGTIGDVAGGPFEASAERMLGKGSHPYRVAIPDGVDAGEIEITMTKVAE